MKRLLLILLITPFLFENSAFATKVQFFNGSFVSAKEKAATEGKLIFVDFTARWCLPCQMMDQTTFNDELLADYLAANFIPVKVDIDDFDGFALKEKYEIQALPSLLIFNAAGELLDRHQEAMSGSKLREILAQYNHPDNKQSSSIVNHKPNSNITTVPTTTAPVTQPDNSYRPPLASTSPAPYTPTPQPQPVPQAPVVVETSPVIVETFPDYVEYAETTPVPVETVPDYEAYTETAPVVIERLPDFQEFSEATPAAPSYESVDSAPEVMPLGQGLFRFTVSRQPSAGFSVQVGAFGHYGNVLAEVEKLQAKIDAPVLVNIGVLRGKTVYKVMLGEFMTRQEAADFTNYLSGVQIPGIVKDLRLMK